MTTTTTTARARQGEAKRATGRETRERLIDVAERLFAEHGIAGVSIRSINAAAGLAPAAVHYHFGTKDRLLDAVVARRGRRMVAHQFQRLDEIEASGRTPSVEDLVRTTAEAFFAQIDRDPEGGRRWIKVIGHLTMSDDRRLQRINADADGLDRLQRTVLAAVPSLPAPFVLGTWRTAVTVLVQLLSRSDVPADSLTAHERDLVVAFVVGGFDRTISLGAA